MSGSAAMRISAWWWVLSCVVWISSVALADVRETKDSAFTIESTAHTAADP
jgi:hypothetical protein